MGEIFLGPHSFQNLYYTFSKLSTKFTLYIHQCISIIKKSRGQSWLGWVGLIISDAGLYGSGRLTGSLCRGEYYPFLAYCLEWSIRRGLARGLLTTKLLSVPAGKVENPPDEIIARI